MSEIFGGGYEELSRLTGTEGLGPDGGRRKPAAMPGEPHEGIVAITVLNRIERELRRIRSFTQEYGRQGMKSDAFNLDGGGDGTLTMEGPKSGNDWYLEHVRIAFNAVAQATCFLAVYAGSVVDDTNIVFSVSLGAITRFAGGNNPTLPIFIYGGQGLTIRVTDGPVGGQAIVNFQYREVLSGADPALRDQDDF